ncbi:MAG: (Fe-S)-binding protein [Candidatus Lokiarchaeota archaeon]|nr:(Fe-S)-binding protein [Candidatus Lokiarchaeota archaeon]
MKKLIFLGCLSNTKYKDTCANAIKLIKSIDPDYVVLDDAPCCGALAYHIGNDIELKDHVEFVNNWFKIHEISEIVTICAGCYNYLTKYYTLFLGNDFKINVQHLLQFLAKPENLKKLNLQYSGKRLKVSYHDACHLRNAAVPIIEEPRQIINSIDNIELIEMENNKTNSICCGAGGGVYSIFKENSDYNSKLIFDQLNRGKILLTACPFCYTAFKRVKDDNQLKKPVIKFEDFIIKLMEGVDPLIE